MSNNKKKKENRHTLRTLFAICGLAWKRKPVLFLCYLVQLLAEVSKNFLGIILPKYIIDFLTQVVKGRPYEEVASQLIFVIGLLITSMLISDIMIRVTNAARMGLNEWFNRYLEDEVAKKSMDMDFEYTEDPKVLDQVNRAKEGVTWYSGGVEGILARFYAIIMNFVVLIGVITIVILGCPWLLLVQGISLCLVAYFNSRNNKIEVQSFMELSALNRRFGYFFYQIADFRYGKDIRLYESVDMMAKKAARENSQMLAVWKKRVLKQEKNNWGADIVNSLRDASTYFYLGYLAATKVISIGDFTMYGGASGSFFWAVYRIVEGVQEITKRCNYISEYFRFKEYPEAMEKGNRNIENTEHIIEFKNVTFRYPRTEKDILHNVNLTIHSGEHLSIVGLNGAGKTTFIKLLCRLYDVNEGEILIDGVNIKEYSDEEYRKLFAVVFQDFQLFAFSLKENVAMQNAKNATDEEINQVLKLSGIYEDTQKLSDGVDTIIYKSYDEDGTELSGGQKQKVAISRALYKNAPIVILDEPTAALDPLAEYEIYKKFHELVGGKTAIYISHRLSSCKFCDHIAVFAEDHIKEYGTHDELVNKENGIYAEMFHAQAQYYV